MPSHLNRAPNPLHSAVDPADWRIASLLAESVPAAGVAVAAENERADLTNGPDDLEAVVMRKPRKLTHTVRRGETLSGIAERYNVESYDIKQWNRMRSGALQPGKKLTILREAGETHTERMARQDAEPVKKKVEVAIHNERERPRYHRVQSGDTLWNIAQRYGGISIDKLKKMNRIKGNSVRPGQKLVVG